MIQSPKPLCSTSIFINFIYSVYSDVTVWHLQSKTMLQMPTSRFICIQTYVWRVCICEVRWIVGNAVMLRGQLTDQAWQHQVAEECEQRPHTRRDEVTQSCRFVVRFTWVTNAHKAELLKHSGTEIKERKKTFNKTKCAQVSLKAVCCVVSCWLLPLIFNALGY